MAPNGQSNLRCSQLPVMSTLVFLSCYPSILASLFSLPVPLVGPVTLSSQLFTSWSSAPSPSANLFFRPMSAWGGSLEGEAVLRPFSHSPSSLDLTLVPRLAGLYFYPLVSLSYLPQSPLRQGFASSSYFFLPHMHNEFLASYLLRPLQLLLFFPGCPTSFGPREKTG